MSSANRSAGTRFRCLIVDDSPDDLAEIRRLLEAHPDLWCEILAANTGTGALRALHAPSSAPIDCIILDYLLPDMSGPELLSRLVDSSGLTLCPVVVLTGVIGHQTGRAMIRAGAQDFIGKDRLTMELLYRAVENAIDRHKAAREFQRQGSILRDSEARLRLALEASHTGLWTWDMRTDVMTWSPECYRIFGVDDQSAVLTAKTFFSMVHPEDLDRVTVSVRDAIAERRLYECDFRLIRPSGELIWISNRGRCSYDGKGDPVQMLGSVTDVTERTRITEELNRSLKRERERAEELATIMRGVPVAIFIAHDPECLHMTGNPESYRIIGMPEGSNSSASRVPSPQDAPRRFREYRDGVPIPAEDLPMQLALRTGKDVTGYTMSLVFEDGTTTHVIANASPLRNPDGSVRGGVATLVDITSLREATASLHRREQEMRGLADNSPDVIARFDREFRHVFVNAAAELATGRPAALFLGKTHRELGSPDQTCDLWETELRSAFETARARRFEFTFDGPRGRRHYSTRLVPELDDEGRVTHVMCVAHDATDIVLATGALREADRQKDDFLATLAHELRNPLAPISNGLELLRRTQHPAVIEIREMMSRQLGHMVRLVDDLSDVSRIRTGKVELQRQRVTVGSVMEQALEASLPMIEAAGHQLTLSMPSPHLLVYGDPNRLAQVFGNLLNNAAKYTQGEGHIEIGVMEEAGSVVVQVRDNGVGISPEALPNVWALFAQIDGTRGLAQGGLGIGLSLVKRLVELHDGSVEAWSPGLGQGSTFTVRLPLAGPPA